MACICWVVWWRCCLSCCETSKGRKSRCPWLRKSLPTTGTSWTGCGSSFSRFFIWENRLEFGSGLALHKFGDSFDYASDLILSQFRIHRQRENLVRGTLGVRKVSPLFAPVSVQGLQMQGIRVVHGAADSARRQMLLERVTLLGSNGVLVVDVFETFRFVRRHDSGDLLQQACVLSGIRTPGALPLRKMAKLDPQDGGLNFVEAAVPAGLAAPVFGGLAVIS